MGGRLWEPRLGRTSAELLVCASLRSLRSTTLSRGRSLCGARDAPLVEPTRVRRGRTLGEGVKDIAGSLDAGWAARRLAVMRRRAIAVAVVSLAGAILSGGVARARSP